MKVILTSDIKNIGRRGELREVADGYYRNYLLPKRLAVLPNDPRAAQLRFQIASKDQTRQAEVEATRKLAASLADKTVAIGAKAQGARLFGAIREAEIAEALEIDKKLIRVQPIKTIGEHAVTLEFGHGVTSQVVVVVRPIGI